MFKTMPYGGLICPIQILLVDREKFTSLVDMD